jgi:hypothetical protein
MNQTAIGAEGIPFAMGPLRGGTSGNPQLAIKTSDNRDFRILRLLSFFRIFSTLDLRARSSGVEHLPFKQRVDGSKPSALTKIEDGRLRIEDEEGPDGFRAFCHLEGCGLSRPEGVPAGKGSLWDGSWDDYTQLTGRRAVLLCQSTMVNEGCTI